MIITRTPFRISFFGGGTDYPQWFKEHGGMVLSTSIDKYAYLSVRNLPPFFEYKSRIVYSKIELVRHIDEIDHPSVKHCLKHLRYGELGLEVHYDGDLPARSGIGSSSSFTVGFLHALYAMRGLYKGSRQLAEEAIHIEQNLIGETVGCQDQIAASFGGFNRIEFFKNGEWEVTPVILPKTTIREFQNHLMLFFTGFQRNASQIAKTKVDNFDKKKDSLQIMSNMVEPAIDLLSDKNYYGFGELLHEAWSLKKDLSPSISTEAIDAIYQKARRAGAIGGKLLGAGGGGFLLLLVDPADRKYVEDALSDYIHVPFKFEREGTKMVVYV